MPILIWNIDIHGPGAAHLLHPPHPPLSWDLVSKLIIKQLTRLLLMIGSCQFCKEYFYLFSFDSWRLMSFIIHFVTFEPSVPLHCVCNHLSYWWRDKLNCVVHNEVYSSYHFVIITLSICGGSIALSECIQHPNHVWCIFKSNLINIFSDPSTL